MVSSCTREDIPAKYWWEGEEDGGPGRTWVVFVCWRVESVRK